MSKQRGFTLIELLIAMTLMAVLAGLSWRGLDGLVRTRDVTQQRVAHTSVVQTVLAQWRADLDAMQPVAGINDAGVSWDGQVLRITRRSSARLNDGKDPGLWVVAWTRRTSNLTDGNEGQWMRWQSPALNDRTALNLAWEQAKLWSQNSRQQDAPNETALLGLTQWQLTYFRGNAWTNPLSSDGKTTSSEQANTTPPDAIRLLLDLPPSTGLPGRLTLDWVRPNFSNSKS
jgi:general secretion pathway protein J